MSARSEERAGAWDEVAGWIAEDALGLTPEATEAYLTQLAEQTAEGADLGEALETRLRVRAALSGVLSGLRGDLRPRLVAAALEHVEWTRRDARIRACRALAEDPRAGAGPAWGRRVFGESPIRVAARHAGRVTARALAIGAARIAGRLTPVGWLGADAVAGGAAGALFNWIELRRACDDARGVPLARTAARSAARTKGPEGAPPSARLAG